MTLLDLGSQQFTHVQLECQILNGFSTCAEKLRLLYTNQWLKLCLNCSEFSTYRLNQVFLSPL